MARHHLTITLWGVMVAVAACGGRNLDALNDKDTDFYGETGAGASGGGEAGGFGGGGVGGTTDGGGGSGASGAGLPTDCFGCLGNNCPDALNCVTNPDCIQGIICAATQCLSGGQPDIMCLTDCFNGDIGAALEALDVITCALGQCQSECGDLLPFP